MNCLIEEGVLEVDFNFKHQNGKDLKILILNQMKKAVTKQNLNLVNAQYCNYRKIYPLSLESDSSDKELVAFVKSLYPNDDELELLDEGLGFSGFDSAHGFENKILHSNGMWSNFIQFDSLDSTKTVSKIKNIENSCISVKSAKKNSEENIENSCILDKSANKNSDKTYSLNNKNIYTINDNETSLINSASLCDTLIETREKYINSTFEFVDTKNYDDTIPQDFIEENELGLVFSDFVPDISYDNLDLFEENCISDSDSQTNDHHKSDSSNSKPNEQQSQKRARKRKIYKVVKKHEKDSSAIEFGIEAFDKFYKPLDPDEKPNIDFVTTDILMNDYPNNSKANINNLEYTFIINKEKLDTLKYFVKNGYGDKNECLEYMYLNEYRKFNNVCVINFTGNQNSKQLSKYARCNHLTCRTYLFKATGNLDTLLTVQVFYRIDFVNDSVKSKNGIIHMNYALSRQTRSISRRIIQSKCHNEKPHNFMRNHRINVPAEMKKAGRRDDISDEQLRMMKYECSKALQRDSDPFIDAVLFAKENPEVYFIQIPLFLMMITKAQYEAFKTSCEKDTVHFDATGAIVAKIPEADKKIFLYAFIGHHKKSSTPIPLALCILSQHTADAIEECFFKLRKFAHENNEKFPPFKRICIDRSAASLLAIVRFFNNFNTTLEFYNYVFELLDSIPDNVLDFEKLGKIKVIPQFCRSHFCHSIAVDGAEMFSDNDKVRNLYVDSLKACVKIENMRLAKIFYKSFCVVFCSKYKDRHFENHLNFIYKFIEDSYEVDSKYEHYDKSKNEFLKYFDLEENPREDENHTNKSFRFEDVFKPDFKTYNEEGISNGTYKDNKFYICFEGIYVQTENELKEKFYENNEINEYYNPKVCLHVIKLYFSGICLWSNMLGKFVNSDLKTISNAIIEGFNKIFKVDELKNDKYLKLTTVLRHLKRIIYHLIAAMSQRTETSKCNAKSIVKTLQSCNQSNDKAYTNRKIKRLKNHSRPLEGKTWKKKNRDVEENETHSKSEIIKTKRRGKYNDNMEFVPKYPNNVEEGWSKKVKSKTKVDLTRNRRYRNLMSETVNNNSENSLVNFVSKHKIGQERESPNSNIPNEKNSDYNSETDTCSEVIELESHDNANIFSESFEMVKVEILSPVPSHPEKSLHNFNIENTKKYLNSNGTFKNTEYYFIKKNSIFSEGKKAHNVLCFPQIKKYFNYEFQFSLDIEELDTINNTKWLNSRVIDISIAILLNESGNDDKISLLTCIEANQILAKKKVSDIFGNIHINKIFMFPLLISNHFILCIADFEKQEFSVIDPNGPINSTINSNQVFDCFLIFIGSNKLLNTKWSLINYRSNIYQVDGYNCGIFVIMFAESILKNLNSKELFVSNPNIYRKTLLKKLLVSSENMLNKCMKCMKYLDNIDNVFKCTFCDRRLCQRCRKFAENREHIFSLTKCGLCLENICSACDEISFQSIKEGNCSQCGYHQCSSCKKKNSSFVCENGICLCTANSIKYL